MEIVLDWRFFYTIVVLGLGHAFAIKGMKRLWSLMKLGRKEDLTKDLGARIALVARNVLGQAKLFKDPIPGIQHFIIFWGFLIITIGTLEMMIEGIIHGFTWSFLGPVYDGIAYVQDFLHPLVFAAVVYGFYRRVIVRPKRLGTDWSHMKDALLVLTLTGTLMLANIFSFGGFVLGGHHLGHAEFRPVSQMIANFLGSMGMSGEAGVSLGYFCWALHLAVVMFFAAYIPNSKHLHVVAAGPNIFFSRQKARGTFSKVNFEDEANPVFGVGKMQQFAWKDILDLYSCTQCGRCNEYCPTTNTGKPLRPMELIEDLKHHLFAVGDGLVKDPTSEPSEPLIGEGKNSIKEETIWACTTCRACVEACPVMIEHVDKIVDMRRYLVMMEGKMPAELQGALRNWETQGNPWGLAQDTKDEWAQGLNVARLADKPDAEWVYYVGCAGSFNDRNKKISQAVVKILNQAGVNFAILGKEEMCNGETARRSGNEYLAKTMIDANVETFKRYNIKKFIASCPHCLNTLKNEYPDFGFQAAEVVHHTKLIETLIEEKKITPKQGESMKVAYHDSCYLGRYNDIYEAPRNVLKSVPGLEVVDPPRNRTKGLCCGAGGARMWMEETIGKRINVERTQELLGEQPKVIASACPFCQVMLEDGVKTENREEVKVRDIAEIVADSI